MANKTITQVRQALTDVITSMRESNGYSLDLAPDNIKDTFDGKTTATSADADYPKIFILIESSTRQGLPSERVLRKVNFMVVAIFKERGDDDEDVTLQVEKFIEDFDRLMMANDTLNGTVQDACMTDYSTDSGNLHPEGAVVFKVEVEYFKQF
jgi:hypothetical protein